MKGISYNRNLQEL